MLQTLSPRAMLAQKKLICAVYTRVSTKEQAKGDFSSLDSQRQICLDFIRPRAAEGWLVSPDSYDDDGYSAKNLNRPAVQRLIADVMAGKINVIVVYRMDRLFRNLYQQLELIEKFENKGVVLYADGQAIDFTSPGGFLSTAVLGAAAQMERMLTAKRTKDKIRESKKLGMWCGGQVPLGYDRSMNKQLELNPTEAAQVRDMFNIYLKVQSLDRALKVINAKYRTKLWTPKHGREKGGHAFHKSPLIHVLKNRLYLGLIASAGEWVPGRQAAMVDKAVFEQVQTMLKLNGHNRATPIRSVVRNRFGLLLRGLVRCEACGARMTPYHASGRNDQRYEYYKCTRSQNGGREACPLRPAPARALEGMVVGRIQQLAQEPDLIQKAIKRTIRKSNADLPKMKSALEKNASRRRKIEDEAERLMKGFADTGAETNAFLIKHLNQLEAEMKGLEEQEAQLKAAIEAESGESMDPEAAQMALAAFTKLYADMGSEERQHMLRLTVREVIYNGDVHDIKMSLHPLGDGGSISDSSDYFGAVHIGSSGWIRTSNPPINSRMLHH